MNGLIGIIITVLLLSGVGLTLVIIGNFSLNRGMRFYSDPEVKSNPGLTLVIPGIGFALAGVVIILVMVGVFAKYLARSQTDEYYLPYSPIMADYAPVTVPSHTMGHWGTYAQPPQASTLLQGPEVQAPSGGISTGTDNNDGPVKLYRADVRIEALSPYSSGL